MKENMPYSLIKPFRVTVEEFESRTTTRDRRTALQFPKNQSFGMIDFGGARLVRSSNFLDKRTGGAAEFLGMSFKVLRAGFSFFSKLYAFYAAVMVFMATAVIAFEVQKKWFFDKDVWKDLREGAFISVLLFLWAYIFQQLEAWITLEGANARATDLNRLRIKIARLLTFAFSWELLKFLVRAAGENQIHDWKAYIANMPTENVGQKITYIYLWMVQLSVSSAYWLTPRTTGLATLALAGAFYYFSQSSEKPR